MKSIVFQLFCCVVIAGGLMGCGGSSETVRAAGMDMPAWAMAQPPLCGVGIQKYRGNVGMAKTAAEGKARADLSRQMETKVRDMIKQYNQEGGTADGDFSEEQSTNVSLSLSKQTLNGAVPTKAKIMGDNYYALVCLKPGILEDAINQMKQLGAAQRKALARRAAKAQAELKEAMESYDD